MTENIDPNDIEDCQKQVFDLEAEVRELRSALERAANDLMLSEESFVKMRDKRDDVLRELHAKSAALEHANRFLEQETLTRQKYGDQLHAAEAALERARALANELQNYAKDKEVEMPVMMAAVVGTMRGIGDRLAAALVAASGGAA